MDNLWSDIRSRILEQNVKRLITYKISDFFCCDFYEKIKLNCFYLRSVIIKCQIQVCIRLKAEG